MLLSQKYAPKTLEHVLGNLTAKKQLKRWMLTWMRGTRQRPLLITGPPGIGKTAMVYALRDELGLDLLEMGPSDFRDRERVERILGGTMSASSLTGKTKLIFIDDIDAMGREDRGGVGAITKLLKDSPFPVLLTAEDSWNRKIISLRSYCTVVQLKRPIAPSVAKLLKQIAQKEQIEASDETINSIAENAHGDIRAAINDLQCNAVGQRDRDKDIFTLMKNLFRAQTYAEAREVSFGSFEHDMLKLWINENIPIVFPPRDLAPAYDRMSRADIFDGRIMRRQAWGFLRYSNDLMTAGVSLSRSDMRPTFVRFQFPSYLKKMKATSSSRATMRSLLTKIGRKVHTSPRRAESYLPVFAGLYSEDPEYFQSNYGIDEKEADLLKKFAPKGRRKKSAKPAKKSAKKEISKKEQVKHQEKQEKPPEPKEEKEEENKNKELPKPTKVEHVGPKLHEFF
ncbi:replication factor C large subunit [Candidatus Micrarchaeota archaeon]|nr:replication factor C large subunit [Candidatus Micrarchaeota archaeon]MBD3417403.1 replication factor C large subunit [Candidatus Micrarchaeota archaeon]